MTYNVYDVYLYKFKIFILAFTYAPILNIQHIIDDIARAFNLTIITLIDYNYNKLNNDINDILTDNTFRLEHYKESGYFGKGILIHGITFPPDELKFNINLHINFALSKKNFLILNNSIHEYNHYIDITKSNIVNKYYNIKLSDIISDSTNNNPSSSDNTSILSSDITSKLSSSSDNITELSSSDNLEESSSNNITNSSSDNSSKLSSSSDNITKLSSSNDNIDKLSSSSDAKLSSSSDNITKSDNSSKDESRIPLVKQSEIKTYIVKDTYNDDIFYKIIDFIEKKIYGKHYTKYATILTKS